MAKPNESQTKQAPKQELVEATLKKPHRHKGFERVVGSKVELTRRQAERLTQREVI